MWSSGWGAHSGKDSGQGEQETLAQEQFQRLLHGSSWKAMPVKRRGYQEAVREAGAKGNLGYSCQQTNSKKQQDQRFTALCFPQLGVLGGKGGGVVTCDRSELKRDISDCIVDVMHLVLTILQV